MKIPTSIIVIDDDVHNNTLCRIIIESAVGELDIQTFEDPETGFGYIESKYAVNQEEIPTVLFLDINMPTWTGWDFLENFEKLEEKIKKQIRVYMLSSSLDPKDRQRAREDKNVVDYIVKPLNSEIVLYILMNPNGK